MSLRSRLARLEKENRVAMDHKEAALQADERYYAKQRARCVEFKVALQKYERRCNPSDLRTDIEIADEAEEEVQAIEDGVIARLQAQTL